MKSFCIKTNNQDIINYLFQECEKIDLDNVYLSSLHFRFYNNFIIHYTGKNLKLFLLMFSEVITNSIIKFYENNMVKNIIEYNFFYFSSLEQKKIYELTLSTLSSNSVEEVLARKDMLLDTCLQYVNDYKFLVLDGFVTFRISNYIATLNSIIDSSVNKFIVDREYKEFTNILKSYVSSKPSLAETIHLIFNNQESILLDEKQNFIEIDDNIFKVKYLSDISFSSNDFALNTLLTLLPQNLIIHTNDLENDFINTLKLIFENNIKICNNCSFCKAYKY